MPVSIESNRPNGKKEAVIKVKAKEEIKVVAVVVIMDDRVEETMRRNNAISIKDNIYGENAHPTGEVMLIKRSMDVVKDESEVETDVVINLITRNSIYSSI